MGMLRRAAALIGMLGAGLPAPARAGLSPGPVWTLDANQANANLGYSVSAAGDVNGDGFSDVIIGARSYDAGEINEGRAIVSLGSASGPTGISWTGDGDQVLAFHGTSVASAGDVNGDGYDDILVGASSWDGVHSNEGRAVVYLGGPSGLAAVPAWERTGEQSAASFGISVAGAGDVNGDGYADVIIGSRGWDGAEANTGRARIYLGGAAGLDTLAAWTVEGTQDDEAFGGAVAGAGDVNGDGFSDVIVGAFFHDDGHTDEGAAFVYLGAAGGPALTPDWSFRPDQADASLGYSVAGAGDVNGDGYADVIVGARYHDDTESNEGRVYVFLGGADGLEASPVWFADGGQANANLGWSVATAGDVNGDGLADVIAGAYRADVTWLDDGEARVYLGTPGGPADEPGWTASSGQQAAHAGWSVSGAGDVDGDGFGDVIVGAYFFDDGQDNEGRALVYRGGADLPASASSWKGAANTNAYGSVATYAGDVNGDGLDDLLVGDPLADAGVPGAGRVDLYFGASPSPDASPAWSVAGTQSGEALGRSAVRAGDVNGDGYDDVLVGSPFFTFFFQLEGRASLYLGSAGGLAPAPAWSVDGGALSLELGASVAGMGDANRDGFADLAIGVPDADGTVASSGTVRVFLGSVGGPVEVVELEGFQTAARFGSSVAGAGDVNGDGFDDLVVGEPGASAGDVEEGRAHLYLGSPSGPVASPAWSGEGDQGGARFGERVATAGDVNGDGYADVLVVASSWDDTAGADEGAAFLFLGGAVGLEASAAWTFASGEAGAALDHAASAGDVNGDGYGDVLIGTSRATGTAGALAGRALVFAGSASGLSPVPIAEWEGAHALARLGSAGMGRGDADGNGWPDLLIGARGHADGSSSGGAAFLYPANGGGGPQVAAQQRRLDGVAPVALGGRSDSPGGVRLAALGGSAAGRAEVRLEWEVKPAGEPFDGTGTSLTPWTDSGPPASGIGSRVALAGDVSGLTAQTLYRWRVRVRSSSPFFPGTPWWTLSGNGRTEADFRTAGDIAAPEIAAAGTPSLRFAPNPFRAGTQVTFTLARAGRVRIDVHDVRGRRVRRLLHDALLPAGEHRLTWNGRDADGRPAAPGVYFLRVLTPDGPRSGAVVRLR